MRILIVEDEPPIADYIDTKLRTILGNKVTEIFISHTLENAQDVIKNKKIDLCFLDLNLKGKDGYELLAHTSFYSFHSIIISAHTDQAVKAFEFGVIDFIPKPFDLNRLRLALDRYFGRIDNPSSIKYLVYRKNNKNLLLDIENVVYFEADKYITKAHLKDGNVKILEKSLSHLEKILSQIFLRVHRSYILNISVIDSYEHTGGGVYKVILKNKEILPLSRNGLKILKNRLKKTESLS